MTREFGTIKVSNAGLALDHNFRAFSLDMLKQLSPCHMLKVFVIAYVAAEFGALIHGMLLELPHGLPDDHALPVVLVALVGELTEVNAVGQHLIDILHEIALGTTPRTLYILRVLGLLELDLAMLAEQFVAITAL